MSLVVAADLGFRSDASAAVAVRVDGSGQARRYTLVDWLELRPRGGPLTPSDVFGRVAQLAKDNGCSQVFSDYVYSESMREALSAHGIRLELGPAGSSGKQKTWSMARQLIHGGSVSVPRLPVLLDQLKSVRSRPTAGGGLSIDIPRRGNSHGDLAAAFILGLWAASQGPQFVCSGYVGVKRDHLRIGSALGLL